MTTSPTSTAVVYTDCHESEEAGRSLAQQALAALGGQAPDALILFVSPQYDLGRLVRALNKGCQPKVLVGCSSAGEFTSQMHGEGRACAIAIRSSEFQFRAGIGRGITRDRAAVAKSIVSAFSGVGTLTHEYSSGLVLTDALAGHADELIEELIVCTGGNYQFFGGGAGDDANFKQTQVIHGEEIVTDAAVVLEILSHKPIGVGVRHGWRPAGKPMRVTESNGAVLVSMNAMRAVDVFAEHAAATGQQFDSANPLSFFLHNILGIETGQGFRLRVPLALGADGSVTCAAEIPEGTVVCIMGTDAFSARNAAAEATRDAVRQLEGNAPNFALFFDCVATRLRMGKEFGYELEGLKEALGPIQFAGCNTYGQLARSEGQFSGFHNCTAVVCVFPA